VKVVAGSAHDCARDGHMVALRLSWDLGLVRVAPFCEVCRSVFLPAPSMSGRQAEWLMEQVEEARTALAAPPEAYDALFADEEEE
jgi:hypothetical protein